MKTTTTKVKRRKTISTTRKTGHYTGAVAAQSNTTRKKAPKIYKEVVKNKRNKIVTKGTTYGPMSTYGTQSKTKSRSVIRKKR